jgi:hypothetical protein
MQAHPLDIQQGSRCHRCNCVSSKFGSKLGVQEAGRCARSPRYTGGTLLPQALASARLYYGSVKALSRLYYGYFKALLRCY